jgi:hypothetical protein
MSAIFLDVKYAIRALLKKPGFTMVALIKLALGIGANTAIFSVVRGVLLKPLPYGDVNRIVTLWQNNVKEGIHQEEVSAICLQEGLLKWIP